VDSPLRGDTISIKEGRNVKRLLAVLLLLALVAAVSGCADKYSCYDCVEPGMSRGQVRSLMGSPDDSARDFMHWQFGRDTDAWVFFDASGTSTGKYWQDRDTLRMDEIEPLLK
jgi:hypothetical protein